MSHPLAQKYVPGEASEAGAGLVHDDTSERVSVISTTSPQNPVTHVRDNTSYDPTLGLGERDRMGHFNENMYLHATLNRRLQEENIDLVARLKK